MHHRKKNKKKRGKNNMRHSRKSRWFSAKTTSRETCETLSPNSYHLKGFLSNQMCGHAFFKSPLAVPPPFPENAPLVRGSFILQSTTKETKSPRKVERKRTRGILLNRTWEPSPCSPRPCLPLRRFGDPRDPTYKEPSNEDTTCTVHRAHASRKP